MTTKRRRLSAQAARQAILDATEEHLARSGPAGIRLQDVAAAVGVSHQAILHHFGSRTELVREAVERSIERLEKDLLEGFAAAVVDTQGVAKRAVRGLSEVFVDKGHARTIAWLYLSANDASSLGPLFEKIQRVARAIHGLRLADSTPGSYEETLFHVTATALTIFAHATAGKALEDAGVDRERFLDWFSREVEQRLAGPYGDSLG